MADLVLTYSSLPLAMTDAAVIAVAERLKLAEVAVGVVVRVCCSCCLSARSS
jgi:hypothetical protein